MSGSKTVYHVSSSTFPMFDDSARINQFAAAMLDYTSNSVIEQSEYIKSYYNSSRLRNYRGYLKWCEKSGFSNTFGKINSNFYGDAQFDNNQIAKAIKHLFSLGKNDTFGVYKTNLSFFSEDFYIKYLATQQGLADKFHTDGDLYYTINYPSDTTIRATLEDGTYVEGELPTGSLNTRFIEISYNILRETQEEYYPPVEELPEEPSEPGTSPGEPTDPEPEPPKPIIITKYVPEYGYYHYKEGSGNTVLDTLIRNNNISASKSFFPPIPLRTNTAWFSGDKATKINDALVYLELFDRQKDKNKAYDDLKKNLAEGMKEGSIKDLDYITMLPGVALNSDNPADQRYLFEFFYNLYFNYALKVARPDPSVARSLYSGSNYFNSFADYALKGFSDSGYTDGYFTKFNLNCAASNLNLTYSWGHADYFESNGQFKPEATIGDYGILGGDYKYTYSYTVSEPLLDDEGNQVYRWVVTGNWGGDNEEGYYEAVYHDVTYIKTVPYTLTLFCHQTSQNRFRFTLFTSLSLTNLVYHGKTINTSSWDAIKAAAVKKDTFIDFIDDVDKSNQDGSWITRFLIKLGLIPATSKSTGISLKYIEATGEIDTPFIVPLEESTFNECGFKNQLDISYGSQYIIINCWVKEKKKWYQRGFLGKALAFIGLAFAFSILPIFPMIGTALVVYFGTICMSIILDATLKIFIAIFGESLGSKLYSLSLNIVKSILLYVANVCKYIPVIGWLIWGICMTAYFFTVSGEYLRQGRSMSFALKNAAIETTVAGAVGQIAGAAGDKVGALTNNTVGTMTQAFVQSSLTTIGTSALKGESIKDAFKSGIKQGAISAVFAGVMQGVSDNFNFNNLPMSDGVDPIDVIIAAETKGAGTVISDAFTNAAMGVVQNPNTYVNLLNMALEERYYHKMANLQNDYQEFNNNLKAAQDALEILNASIVSTATAEFVCLMQTTLNRTCADPDNLVEPEVFLNMGVATGSDIIKTVLGNPSIFAEDKLTIKGYSPSSLYFTQTDYTMSWDVS